MSASQAFSYLDEAERAAFSPIGLKTFGFRHGLASSPLVQMDALRDLARFMQDQQLSYHFECARGGPESGWGSQPKEATLLDTFDALVGGNALILLKSVHRHPDYNRLLSTFLAELGQTLGVDMARDYRVPICTIILASPHRITPYHMDDSHNFLMQVHGSKRFYVFDGTDPEIVSDHERDAFWGGDANAAVLTDAKQQKAILYDLGPTSGVHVPTNYPHWAQNGSDVSVAVSINFRPVQNRLADVYALNNLLRRRGLHPRPPGKNRVVDECKVVAFRTLFALKSLAQQKHRSS